MNFEMYFLLTCLSSIIGVNVNKILISNKWHPKEIDYCWIGNISHDLPPSLWVINSIDSKLKMSLPEKE